jgi:general transcription factor 3C polypeptide 2
VPSSAESSQIPGGLPQLLALLWHDGRLAWDVQWCPNPSHFIQPASNSTGASSSSSSTVPLQGLLAAALGNGDVVVWGVPTIQCLLDLASQQQQPDAQQQQQQTLQALSLRLPFVWQMPSAAVGGSLASCCSWLPTAPHDKLLVGCYDGNVVIWQLSLGAQGEPTGWDGACWGLRGCWCCCCCVLPIIAAALGFISCRA